MSTRLRFKVVAVVLAVGGLIMPASGATSVTIATFADPAPNASTPLFHVDLATQQITGGWQSTGLALEFPWHGSLVNDVYFTLTDLSLNAELDYTLPIPSNPFIGVTDGGFISFYENQTTNLNDLILKIEFSEGLLTSTGIGASELTGTIVNITDGGSRIPPLPLTNESFSFSFANQTLLPGGGEYTATASFTSSAVPEPATAGLLIMGLLLIGGHSMRFWRRPAIDISANGLNKGEKINE